MSKNDLLVSTGFFEQKLKYNRIESRKRISFYRTMQKLYDSYAKRIN